MQNTSNFLGLSGSRLNRRYRDNNAENLSPEDLELESISQRGGLLGGPDGGRNKTDKMWDQVGLSKTPLNERYFSQPDLIEREDGMDSKTRPRYGKGWPIDDGTNFN